MATEERKRADLIFQCLFASRGRARERERRGGRSCHFKQLKPPCLQVHLATTELSYCFFANDYFFFRLNSSFSGVGCCHPASLALSLRRTPCFLGNEDAGDGREEGRGEELDEASSPSCSYLECQVVSQLTSTAATAAIFL